MDLDFKVAFWLDGVGEWSCETRRWVIALAAGIEILVGYKHARSEILGAAAKLYLEALPRARDGEHGRIRVIVSPSVAEILCKCESSALDRILLRGRADGGIGDSSPSWILHVLGGLQDKSHVITVPSKPQLIR